MLCFRLLNEDEPAAPLASAVDALRNGQSAGNVFDVDPASFRQVPNAPFAYWVSESLRLLFSQHQAFESESRTARRGPSSGDDFRRVRCWWEQAPENVSPENGWVPFSKGGAYSPFYADVHLLVSWENRRNTFHGFLGRPGRMIEKIESVDCFFRPGVTWPLRTNGLSFRILPSGCAFGHKGPTAFAKNDHPAALLGLLSLVNSTPFGVFVSVQTARVELAQSFEVGLIQNTPVPSENTTELSNLGKNAWAAKRSPDTAHLTSHAFFAIALTRGHDTLSKGLAAWSELLEQSKSRLADLQYRIDEIAYQLYGISDKDRQAIQQMLSKSILAELTPDSASDEEDEDDDTSPSADAPSLVSELLDYAVGCAFGRWDIRYATGAKAPPPEPDPFDPLPVCPPGMLQNTAGLPAAPAEVPGEYPLRITWSGILVDDPHQPTDIEHRVREVFAVIYGEHADSRVDEAVALLGVANLRDYLLKPAGFFAGHFARHKKSRRQAPIYWPLSSPKGLTTVWLYYHRLTPDTFFTTLREHIKPRIDDEERRLFNLKQQAGPSATPSQVREIGGVEDLVEDLRALRDELQNIAPLWRPDLNDGVIINHAPLWRMANHAPWRKALKETWDALVAGKYDWAHLALHLWPERVIPQCAKDRSLAIAHDVEEFFWAPDLMTTAIHSRQRSASDIAELVTERTSPAVKAALDSLLSAAAPSGGTTKRGRKKS